MRKKKMEAKAPPSITEAEWEVMKVLWDSGPRTTNQVVDALAPRKDWKPKTIHTLLRRLVDKSALSVEKQGREFLYTPLVVERDCQLAESETFLRRVFGGELAPFLAAFVEREQLTPREIQELKRILDGGK